MKKNLNLYEQIDYNKRLSIMIMVGFAIFLVIFAAAVSIFLELPIESTLIIGIIFLVIMFLQYTLSTRMILGITGAREISRAEYPFIYHSVEGLAIAAGIPAPKCYIIDSPSPNAFATGRNPKEGVVALTTGLMQKLNNEEIEGVIAHEIAHIQNYDIRVTTIAIAFVGIISLVGELIIRSAFYGRRMGRSSRRGSNDKGQGPLIILAVIFLVIAPLFAKLLHLTLSRRREFLADASGTFITRNPMGLASALRKISGDTEPLENATSTTAPLFIVNPLNKQSRSTNLFSTHPPIKERIEILERMGYKN